MKDDCEIWSCFRVRFVPVFLFSPRMRCVATVIPRKLPRFNYNIAVRHTTRAMIQERETLRSKRKYGAPFQDLATEFDVPPWGKRREITAKSTQRGAGPNYPQPSRRHWRSVCSTFSRQRQRILRSKTPSRWGIPNLQNLGRPDCRGSSTVTLMFPRSLDPIWTHYRLFL